jgi:2-methylcitrate dehydratase PrpD
MAQAAAALQAAPQQDFAEIFANFSSGLRVETLPPHVVQAAKTNLFDTLSCAIAGVSAPGVGEVADLVRRWGGSGEAALWMSQDRVPAHHAAWINGMMAHARDYDDTHDAAVLHAGVSVVPAALAAAELKGNATGADVLAGIVVGLELICRLGVATKIGIIESGFIYTSLFGYFGATAAAARVFGLDAAATVNAIGIAYSQAAGTHQVTRDAALTKRMQPGFAAKAALLSVQLAEAGIRGAQATFEGADGLFRTYLRDQYDPAILRNGLGRQFEFVELSYKPYPCCRFDHTAIDAALQIRANPAFAPDRVSRIVVGTNKQAFEAVCTPEAIRKHPKTIVQAQFSIPYTVACALVDGRVGLGHFTEQGLQRADILALTAKVETGVDAGIERDWGRNISPTQIRLELAGGGVIESRVDYPRGHTRFPMLEADFDAKLADCVALSGAAMPEDTVARLRTAANGLERAADAGAVLSVMRPGV